MNTIQKHEFEEILRKLNTAGRIVDRISSPGKIRTSKVSIKDCDFNLASQFVVRKGKAPSCMDAKRK